MHPFINHADSILPLRRPRRLLHYKTRGVGCFISNHLAEEFFAPIQLIVSLLLLYLLGEPTLKILHELRINVCCGWVVSISPGQNEKGGSEEWRREIPSVAVRTVLARQS